MFDPITNYLTSFLLKVINPDDLNTDHKKWLKNFPHLYYEGEVYLYANNMEQRVNIEQPLVYSGIYLHCYHWNCKLKCYHN